MRRLLSGGAILLSVVSVAAAQEWKVSATAKAVKNPVARTAGMKDGKPLYESNCVLCHGVAGKGDGPAGMALNPKPRNLADKAVQGETDGQLFWKISEGRGVMPSFKSLTDKDRWSLVHYLRSLAEKK